MPDEQMNQGLPVAGYREQPQSAVDLVNIQKRMEEELLRHMESHDVFDHRWLAIARTHIETGFMALNRAVFKPERVKL